MRVCSFILEGVFILGWYWNMYSPRSIPVSSDPTLSSISPWKKIQQEPRAFSTGRELPFTSPIRSHMAQHELFGLDQPWMISCGYELPGCAIDGYDLPLWGKAWDPAVGGGGVCLPAWVSTGVGRSSTDKDRLEKGVVISQSGPFIWSEGLCKLGLLVGQLLVCSREGNPSVSPSQWPIQNLLILFSC